MGTVYTGTRGPSTCVLAVPKQREAAIRRFETAQQPPAYSLSTELSTQPLWYAFLVLTKGRLPVPVALRLAFTRNTRAGREFLC